ncbi:MAG TPA: aspartate/glutamate racemase family protein, partial [Burkholderiaceae bacterium]|nr:aspartate/glutamate racemase family protein [Burkholderiaceae bacterium]
LQAICADLAAQGAEGIILGCTELPLILGADDLALPLFDTTTLHALAAVDFALEAPVPWPEGVLPVEAVDTVH